MAGRRSARKQVRGPAGRHYERRRQPELRADHSDSGSFGCLDRALARREGLLADDRTTACRVFNGAADGIDGLAIEQLGDVLVVQLHEGRLRLAEASVRELCEHARRRLEARAVYRKSFARDRSAASGELNEAHASPTPWLGEAVERECAVLENDIRFLVRPYDGYSTGLFLEHRDNRRRVRRLAARRSMLNAFAYTCGFSVAAALGGAAGTVSVDVSKKYLEWGKRNFAANELSLADHRFIRSDVFDYYRRARRRRHSFDLIVLDPPTFARTKRPKRVFVLKDDLERLVAGALELLESGGYLLLATNQRGITLRRLERAVADAASPRRFEIVERPQLPADFAGDPTYAKSILARVD